MNILLLFTGFIIAFAILFYYEYKIRQIRRTEPKNKVHFYIARDKIGDLFLYMGKPIKDGISYKAKFDCVIYLNRFNIENYGLNKNDYANLKFEDGPVEVFINIED